MDYPEYRKNRNLEYLFQQAKGGSETALLELEGVVYTKVFEIKITPSSSEMEKDCAAEACVSLIETIHKEIRSCKFEWRSEKEFWRYVWKVWTGRYINKLREEVMRHTKEVLFDEWEKMSRRLGLEEETPKEVVEQQTELLAEDISEEERFITETAKVMDTPALYDIELDLFGVEGEINFESPKMKNFLQRIADRVAWRLRGRGISPATLSRLRGRRGK